MDAFCSPEKCDTCPGRLVCRCLQVTEEALLEAIANSDVQTLRDIRQRTGAGNGCNGCHSLLNRYLEERGYSLSICSVK